MNKKDKLTEVFALEWLLRKYTDRLTEEDIEMIEKWKTTCPLCEVFHFCINCTWIIETGKACDFRNSIDKQMRIQELPGWIERAKQRQREIDSIKGDGIDRN